MTVLRSDLDRLLSKADLIDEVSDTLYYFGFLEVGGTEATASCLIIRMQKTGTVWKRQYPAGNAFLKDQIWNDRATLTYQFKR